MISDLRNDLKKLANPKKAKSLQWFFKTEKGGYGEGDIFLGIIVPKLREVAKRYKDLSFKEIEDLMTSKIHEERMIALLILTDDFAKNAREVFNFYIKHIRYINNWDLVDVSAPVIVGQYLFDKKKSILIKLAKSKSVWERRIAIISTYYFIRFKKEYEWTFKISEILLNDSHDLIQKAVGWMLREVGKNISQKIEEDFLRDRYQKMPRTMLRYSIEHFDQNLRKFYLSKTPN